MRFIIFALTLYCLTYCAGYDITAPVEDQVYFIGDSVVVTWDTTDDGFLTLWLVYEDADSVLPVIALHPHHPDKNNYSWFTDTWGRFAFAMPNTVDGKPITEFVFRVLDWLGDTSGSFTFIELIRGSIIEPAGNEDYLAGETIHISWPHDSCITHVVIAFSSDDQDTWTYSDTVLNTGTYSFITNSGMISNVCYMNIIHEYGLYLSQSAFHILPSVSVQRYNVKRDTRLVPTQIYDIRGRKVQSLRTQGIYIIREGRHIRRILKLN